MAADRIASFLVMFLLSLLGRYSCWNPDCQTTDVFIFGERPRSAELILTDALRVLQVANANSVIRFPNISEAMSEDCELASSSWTTAMSKQMSEREANCSIVCMFACETIQIAAAVSTGLEIDFLDVTGQAEVSAMRTYAYGVLVDFFQIRNISGAVLICNENETDAFMLAMCTDVDFPAFKVFSLQIPVYIGKQNVDTHEDSACRKVLEMVSRMSSVFIFATSLGKVQLCMVAAAELLQNCNALVVVVSDERSDSQPITLTERPVSTSIIQVVIRQQYPQSDNLASRYSNPINVRYARRLSRSLAVMLDTSADSQTLYRFNATLSLRLENGQIKTLTDSDVLTAGGTCLTGRQADAETSDSTYAGIVYGMVGALVLLLIAAVWFCRRENRKAAIGKHPRSRTEETNSAVDEKDVMTLIIPPDDLVELTHVMASRSFAFSVATSTSGAPIFSPEIHLYHNQKVWVKQRELSYSFAPEAYHLQFLRKVKRLNHPNIASLKGILLSQDPLIYEIKIVMEHCARGSLYDLIVNESFDFTYILQTVLIKDIVTAMTFLHNSFIVCHGSLKSPNCLISDRFNIKITDYGLNVFPVHPPSLAADESLYRLMLWTAPEILRGPIIRFRKGTKPGDVYSFAIILQEIFTRSEPYQEVEKRSTLTPKDIVKLVIERSPQPFRPHVPTAACRLELHAVMMSAWAETPQTRLTFKEIGSKLQKLPDFTGNASYLDYLIHKMTEYSEQLEHRVTDATRILLEEKKLSDELLVQMMPKSVLDRLKRGQTVDPETFDQVTLGITAVTDFANFVYKSAPLEVVEFLNSLYYMFDDIIEHFDIYKVETIQESYVLASGLPIRNGDQHSAEVARMGLAMFCAAHRFDGLKNAEDGTVRLKLGVHTGGCVAGVVGLTAPRYCLFGDTINTTSRMCSIGKANEIVVSQSTQTSLETIHPGTFELVSRGETEVKGKGLMETFSLIQKN